MRRIIKIIATALATVSIFSIAACTNSGGNNNTNSNNSSNNSTLTGVTVSNEQAKGTVSDYEDHFVTEGQLHKINVTESNRPFVTNGKSDYKIVIGEGNVEATNAKTEAAGLVAKQVRLATGAALEIVSVSDVANWSETSKWIVFGDAELFANAGLTMPEDDLGYSGYYMKSVGDSIFIATNHIFGYQQAAISFLKQVIGFEIYTNDTIVYKKDGKFLPTMEIIEKPDFQIHEVASSSLTAESKYAMGFVGAEDVIMPLGGELWHNVIDVLPHATYKEEHPNWYASNDANSICYTARLAPEEREDDKLFDEDGNPNNEYAALVLEVANKMTEACVANPNMIAIPFTMEDCAPDCYCDECLAEKERYGGAASATVVKFMNDVDNLVQAWIAENQPGREVYLLFFAYQVYAKSPTKIVDGKPQPIDESVVCNPHVAPYIALLDDTYYNQSFYHEKNEIAYNAVTGWQALADTTFIWPYETNFHSAMYPFNTFDTMQETYRFLKANDALFVRTESCWFQSTTGQFERLKTYVGSKVMHDVNVNYAELVNDFFTQYFEDASEPMRRYFDEMQAYLRWLEKEYPTVFTGYIYEAEGKHSTEFWPKQTMESWLKIMDEAYQSIERYKESNEEKYNRLKDHITLETLFPRYVLITFYEGTYSSDELYEMRVAFKNDCQALGVSVLTTGVGNNLSDLYLKWGI